MSIDVETGNGSSTANSYVSVAYADEYFGIFGNPAWPAASVDDDVDTAASKLARKELALKQASRAVDDLFGNDYKSAPANQTQALLFPRFMFYVNGYQYVNSTTIPRQLKDAVCEMALMALNDATGVALYPDYNESGLIQSYTKKVGELSKSVTFVNGGTSRIKYTGFSKIELMLAPLLSTTDGYTPSHLSL